MTTIIKPICISVLLSLCAACGGSESSSETDPIDNGDNGTTTPVTTIETEFGLWLTDLSTNVILPAYANFAEKTVALEQVTNANCTPDITTVELTELQHKWRETNLAWQQIQWIKVGPILNESRTFRIQFWPDDNDAVDKGVLFLLETTDTVDADYVANRNVGAQGLPALEQLFYSQSQEHSLLTATNTAKRCEVAQAIATNLKNIGSELTNEWSADSGNYVASLLNGTGEFTGIQDAVEELVTNWLEQIERIKDDKLLAPLADASPGDIELAEHGLSNTSLLSLQVNMQTLLDIYTAGDGHGFDDILVTFAEQPEIASQLSTLLISGVSHTTNISESFNTLLASEEGRDVLNNVVEDLRELRIVMSADFIQALEINIGFNANDGD